MPTSFIYIFDSCKKGGLLFFSREDHCFIKINIPQQNLQSMNIYHLRSIDQGGKNWLAPGAA